MPRSLLAPLLALTLLTPLRAQSPDTLLADHHYLRARPAIQAALARNPNDPHALVDRSVLEWAFNHFDEAIATAEKAVNFAPNSAEAHTQLTNTLGAKLVASNAGTFEKMGLARRFRKEAELSVQLDPNSLDALEDLARFHNEAPGIVGGDKSKVVELANRVTKLDPARGAALRVSFLPQTAHAEAVALWRAAVATAPNSSDAHTGLGTVLFALENNPAAAEAEFKRALSLKPARIAPFRQLAVLYATTGNLGALEDLLKQARAAIPDDLSPFYHAAKTSFTANKDLSRAEGYLRAYLSQPAEGEEPSHAAAHWRLALILEKEGRTPEAIQELQRAIKEDPAFEAARKELKRLS